LGPQKNLEFPALISFPHPLPFQLKLTLLLALFLQPLLLLDPRIGLVPTKHLLEAVADSVRSGFMASAICPHITPGNARQALFDRKRCPDHTFAG
jgi:hypothetical protein